jgi:GNAT superfamily N-acetyltransferase
VTQAWTLRSERRTGDLAWLLGAHADLARELGWDATFEAYVAQPMATSILKAASYEQLWIAEHGGKCVGSIAIVQADFVVSDTVLVQKVTGHIAPMIVPVKLETAQLRWFLVQPEVRGQGLGRLLLEEAIAFSRQAGYQRIILWTVGRLEAATRLYRAAGFEKSQEIRAKRWGAEVVEEQYTLWLGAKGRA